MFLGAESQKAAYTHQHVLASGWWHHDSGIVNQAIQPHLSLQKPLRSELDRRQICQVNNQAIQLALNATTGPLLFRCSGPLDLLNGVRTSRRRPRPNVHTPSCSI